ncbi:hypothetical protein QR680_003221 [Steinernema hermaphroditum]|uniref:Uncharacterized protein n=1 Tax=Steinernema hermaphroditum TaxID=289476 RepID=A0AA39LJW0_9BILA|nr:hypothetical protein QR680_003221 [Steinernema hermaphroditum]
MSVFVAALHIVSIYQTNFCESYGFQVILGKFRSPRYCETGLEDQIISGRSQGNTRESSVLLTLFSGYFRRC